jgi:hypothetical protein
MSSMADETALAVIADAITYHPGNRAALGQREKVSEVLADAVVAALSAAGFVLLPRDLLDELLAVGEASAAVAMTAGLDRSEWITARRAVVEAVGPTP